MRPTSALFLAVLLILSVLGSSSCTLITQVDRSKIGEAGAAGASSDGESTGGSSN